MHSFDGLIKKAALVRASLAFVTLCTAAFSFPLLTTCIKEQYQNSTIAPP
ncbi:hypothetical protein BVRB_5g120980 [Beta vulgaris subsp. vulgaris]|nr:hypothetical protein BVRB_5g120980 [Beta vulgaris subsp. vulgaris]